MLEANKIQQEKERKKILPFSTCSCREELFSQIEVTKRERHSLATNEID